MPQNDTKEIPPGLVVDNDGYVRNKPDSKYTLADVYDNNDIEYMKSISPEVISKGEEYLACSSLPLASHFTLIAARKDRELLYLHYLVTCLDHNWNFCVAYYTISGNVIGYIPTKRASQ
ncbi:MAG: hypothetical protein AABZ06_11380 [Bdellovibrionota bacterium]